MALRVLTYKEIDRTEWGRLVRESETGTWFQSPEAYEFFASMPELFEPFAVAVEKPELKELRAVCVGYVTKERGKFKQFFTRRAIVNGGVCLVKNTTNTEVQMLLTAIRERLKNKTIYIETRNFNDYSRWREAFEEAGFCYKRHLNFHVDCTDEVRIWERLSDNRKRQIKRVDSRKTKDEKRQTANVTEQDIREWYGVLAKLYRTKVKTPLWPVEFFLEAHRQGVGNYLFVRHEGKVIGGSMVVTDGKCVYEWFECGMNAEYKEQYPSVMATWAGMQYAYQTGCARYDMMGAGEPGVPYGVRDFKGEFGGEQVEHGRCLCVCKPWLYQIGVLGVRLLKG